MNIPSVSNLESRRTNRPVANQYHITSNKFEVFQSYQTVIVYSEYGNSKTYIDPKWNYSVTTLKYFKNYMGWERYTKKEIEKMIADNPEKYEIKDLN
jgi:hypothetical protein